MIELTRAAVPSPTYQGGVKKRRFHRQAQDTEFIEVQGQPRTSPGLWFGKLTIPSEVEGQAGEPKG